jgi:hypothetical protein
MGLAGILKADYADLTDEAEGMPDFSTQQELDTYIAKLESDMREAAKKFEFEKAAKLRDTVKELRTKEFGALTPPTGPSNILCSVASLSTPSKPHAACRSASSVFPDLPFPATDPTAPSSASRLEPAARQ